MKIEKTKIQKALKKFLNREPSEKEIQNGYTDQNIINELMMEEIDSLKEEIVNLKKR